MAAVIIAKSGAGHCWMLALATAPSRALFGGGGDRTSRSYSMDRPIWVVLHVPGGAGWGVFRNPVVAGLRDPITPLSARDVIERPFYFNVKFRVLTASVSLSMPTANQHPESTSIGSCAAS